jgi:hypothetical protein
MFCAGFADWLDHISDVEVLAPKAGGHCDHRVQPDIVAPAVVHVLAPGVKGSKIAKPSQRVGGQMELDTERLGMTEEDMLANKDKGILAKTCTGSGSSSSNEVVDDQETSGPSNIDLASIRAVYKEEAASNKELDGIVADTSLGGEIEKEPLGAGLDGFVLKGVLEPSECRELIHATESLGFSFWNPASQRRDYRNADTVEVTHQGLAHAIWSRIRHLVVGEVTIRAGTARYSKELEGTWVAVGMNPNMLFNRYGAGSEP